MTIAIFEGDIRGVRSNRGEIASRVEHCDTFSKFDWEHFVTSSQLSFQVAGMAGLMIPSYRVTELPSYRVTSSMISGSAVHKISELGRMRLA